MSKEASLFDIRTGEVLKEGEKLKPGLTACTRCAAVAIGDVELLEAEKRKLLRKVKRLERERDEDAEAGRQRDPHRAEILEAIDLWKEAAGHPKAVASADRFDLIRARINEGYTLEQIRLALVGIGAFPYVVNGMRVPAGKPGNRHDRMGIALGGGEALEKFANLGSQV